MSTLVASEDHGAFSQATIVDSAKSCLESFQQCLNDASKAEKVILSTVSKLSLVRIEDQLARFSLWAANLRVFSTSRDSLDSRLREAPDVKNAIIGLLEALDYHAKTCARFLVCISSQSTSKPVEECLEDFDNALDELRNDITLLHKTSNTIRQASRESQNIKAAEVFQIRDDEGNNAEPFLRHLFSNYIRDRFPRTTEDIRERLADTMLLRRKRILYRKERYGKTSIRLPQAVPKPVISHPRTEPIEEVTQGRVKRRAVEAPSQSRIQSMTRTATTLSPEKFKKAAAPSVISVSRTVALSSTDELCFPPPPTASLMRKYNKAKREIGKQEDYLNYSKLDDEECRQKLEEAAFKRARELNAAWNSCIEAVAEVTCPYCFHILPIRDVINENKWKLHVKNDLDPYSCLFEKCDSPDHLYSHSSTWVKHMKEHALRWRCKSKAHGEFLANNKTDYVEHMTTSHPGKFTPAQLGILADRNAHTNGALFTSCPLCGIDKTDKPMEHHIVGHMRL
ncbi:Ff.00g084820.m01.CDS01 [Fusarium sp. VM40]|nr:Ff.00g084820.m01.CDS01 [Fusarium sp. VM40]